MVIPRSALTASCRIIVAAILLFEVGTLAQAKSIRLRNEIIEPDAPASRVVSAATANIASASQGGLYLVQFTGPLGPRERAELQAADVELLKYVPEDAYVARLGKVSPSAVAAKSYVTWIGPYKPEHKVHPRLSAQSRALATTNATQRVNVNLMLTASAAPAEIAAVRSLLVSVQSESRLRQGIILRAQVLPAQVEALAQSGAVLWIENAPKRKLVDEAASKLVGGDDFDIATPTVTQQLGYNGSNIIVCVADTGLDTGNTNTMHPDLHGRVVGFQGYGSVTNNGSDGYGHGTHCAGIVAGNAATGETDPDTGQFYGLGVASGASLFIERIFDSDANPADPFPSDDMLARDAVRHGAKIGSNSWGNDVQGDYDSDAAQFDELVRDADSATAGDQPYVLEFSAGNAGPDTQTIGSPATAKNVIATGASQNVPGTLALTYGLYADGEDAMADFSSRGPCADGRIKPDVVAPGTWIASAASFAAPDEASIAWTAIDDYYVYMGGTSMAGPHAAGAAAVFMQFYKATHTNAIPSPALVKAALINSADELDIANGGPAHAPNNDEGWGRINLENIVVNNVNTAPRFYQYLDQTALLTNSQVFSQHIFVQGSDEPLKVTLAYTDVPGFPGAIPALVNDLDLEVVAPDGTLYRGNQFGAQDSVANPPNPDKLNNVEGIFLSQPATGDYLIRVRASKVVQDARVDTAAVDQDFALVSSGNFVRPGSGFILLDRPAYTAPGGMKITVFDAARAASNSVSVTATNLTAHLGLSIEANAFGNFGAFTGTVATVTGAAGPGQIQIAHGDNLEANYLDAGNIQRSATAVADLVPPGITSVGSSTADGVLTITWQTSEPSTSLVRYGTNSANLSLAVTNLALVTSHVVKLTRLIPGMTYYYTVVSSDAASNTSTNNNSGANYTFIGVATPLVLMVDDYDSEGENAAGATVIPDSVYTDVLSAAGISYAFWKVTSRGYPQLADLQPYPVVIWRTTDDAIYYGVDEDGFPDPGATHNTLSPDQQFMIQSYLNGGGGFFMASMEILSQIGDVPFRRNVFQVAGYKQNPAPPLECSSCDQDSTVPAFLGSGSTVAGGMNVTLDYSQYPSFDFDEFFIGPDLSDTFTPAAGSTAIAFESVSGKPCGMSYPRPGVDSPGRVVFLSFPFDTIPASGTGPNSPVTLLQNIVNFLAPGANGLGIVSLDNSAYTTNAAVTVQVGDADLAGSGQTQVSFAASSRTNLTTVTLFETTHSGLFKGFVTLVPGVAGTNELRVQHGDTITATYVDASTGSNITASATVDTVPPSITNTTATTDYANAKVTWKTSKLADSAVQYGSQQQPANTVFLSALVTNHDVTISGLVPNHVYYYKVVSRDLAGNTTIDDNHGNLYIFQTLKAPSPPWLDDLEHGTLNWSAVPDPQNGSDINWTLGTPHNGLATQAHSGTNAWGSNLDGEQNFFLASSYLVSPIIDLSGLKSATLTFWTTFDFTRVDPFFHAYYEEDGGVFVKTNSNQQLSMNLPLVWEYVDDATAGWEERSLDLTKFVGQSIQLVFYYQGLAFGDEIYGWTIDDVGITGVVAAGNITITKNLGQGTWSLSSVSPIGLVPVQSDNAPSITLSNVPPGKYVVQFSDVPYYQTPGSQTNTLVTDGSVSFNGNYDCLDVNTNGISDAWEQDKFGSVTNRSQQVDSDHDGLSDYAEFIAGTNPTNAASRFYFTGESAQTNHTVQIQWTVVTNRLYQVYGTTNPPNWQPVTPWLQASNSPIMIYAATNPGWGPPRFYRVLVQP